MRTIARQLKTLTEAEEIQNGLYDEYDYVRLVSSPMFAEAGQYVWHVTNDSRIRPGESTADNPRPGMVSCTVEWHAGCCLLVTFDDGRDLLLQSDYDQAAFANRCGLIPTDDPASQEWIDCEPTDITECPDDYLELASKA